LSGGAKNGRSTPALDYTGHVTDYHRPTIARRGEPAPHPPRSTVMHRRSTLLLLLLLLSTPALTVAETPPETPPVAQPETAGDHYVMWGLKGTAPHTFWVRVHDGEAKVIAEREGAILLGADQLWQ